MKWSIGKYWFSGTYEVLFYMKKSVQIIKVVISKRNFDKLGSEGQYKFTKKVSKLAFPKKVYNFWNLYFSQSVTSSIIIAKPTLPAFCAIKFWIIKKETGNGEKY